jgi:spore coat polysaccharide biosynthesis protein SpsF (cytidylyltransferase family)
MRKIEGVPMIGHEIRRLQACSSIDEIVLATTERTDDDELAAYARHAGVGVHRGSEQDVLGRMVGAAKQAGADVVIRITGDCPLIDPGVVARVVDELVEGPDTLDYASNVLRRTYPRGLDTEVIRMEALLRTAQMATTALEREHVTVVIRSTDPEKFIVKSIEDSVDNSDLRWTIDELADFRLLTTLFERMDLGSRVVPYTEIVAEQRAHPELIAINQSVETWSPVQKPTDHGGSR